jgi:hypothetical protein
MTELRSLTVTATEGNRCDVTSDRMYWRALSIVAADASGGTAMGARDARDTHAEAANNIAAAITVVKAATDDLCVIKLVDITVGLRLPAEFLRAE